MKLRPSHNFVRCLLFALGLSVALVTAACGSPAPTATPQAAPTVSSAAPAPPTSASAPPAPKAQSFRTPVVASTPASALNLKGNFVFALGDGSISVEAAGSNQPQVVLQASSNLYGDMPAFSPDGKQIALSASSFTKDGAVLQDLRLMNVDGSNIHVVASPSDPKTTYSSPAWSLDGKNLYFTLSYPIPPASQHDEIDVVSAAGGPPHKVLENAREGALSPDGKKIVYSRLDYTTYSSSMWVANIDGSSPKQLLPAGVFAAVYGGRFSPDMQSIVFAESGPANRNLPGAYAFNPAAPDDACAVALAFVCLVENAQAHGLPWDIWLVTPDGGKFERLTNIGADSPVPAWSADGKQIAFYDATGIYLLDVASKKINQISNSSGYGGFDWRGQ